MDHDEQVKIDGQAELDIPSIDEEFEEDEELEEGDEETV